MLLWACTSAAAMDNNASLLIDDFSHGDGRSALGTRWQGFTDRVMGGRSEMRAGLVDTGDGPAMAMAGSVRLDNNGGFIQVRLPLAERSFFDARDYRAIRLRVRGQPGPYFLHLRTANTRLPWQYYRAALTVTPSWEIVEVPLADFVPESLTRDLDPSRLQSLAIVAYGERFDASIEIAKLEWVR